jgi:hypothetical protein
MACSSGCYDQPNIKVDVPNTKPKEQKGIALGGSQISSLPKPVVTIKKY